jgi:hypothetical protein
MHSGYAVRSVEPVKKRRVTVSQSHYEVILKELKESFAQVSESPGALRQEVAEQVRQRFIFFLDADQTLSLEEVLSQLEQKWLADGLLVRPEELS